MSKINRNKVAIIADSRNWALGNIAKYIVRNLSDKYEFHLFYTEDYPDSSDLYIELFSERTFDLVHVLFRRHIFNILLLNPFLLKSAGAMQQQKYQEGFADTIITTSVYDHLFLKESDIKKHSFFYNYVINGYTVSSEKLFAIYDAIDDYPPPDAVIEDGVDAELFYPKKFDKVKNKDGTVIGWVGNSRWGMEDGQDHKGLHTIIIPALDSLRKQGLNLTAKFADRNEGFIPQQQMPEYYHSIDILLCASDIEGTPNPVLEAMACGVPVISTNVGIVPQVFGPLQQHFILSERTPECLAGKLKELIQNPDLYKKLVRENVARMKNWTRKHEAIKWDRFFSRHLSAKKNHNRKEYIQYVKAGVMSFQGLMISFEMLRSRVQKRPIFIWGAGQGGHRVLAFLNQNGFKVEGFIDRDPAKTGSMIQNIPIHQPGYLQELLNKKIQPFVFIGSSHTHSIGEHLKTLGFEAGRDFQDCDFLW